MKISKLFYLSLVAFIFLSGCIAPQQEVEEGIEEKGKEVEEGIEIKETSLREAYEISKSFGKSKLGEDAEIFHAISFNVNEKGKSETWFITFCSQSKRKIISVLVNKGKLLGEARSELYPIPPIANIPKELENCVPLKSGWKDSTEIIPKDCTNATLFGNVQQEENYFEVKEWMIQCRDEMYVFDVYTGELKGKIPFSMVGHQIH